MYIARYFGHSIVIIALYIYIEERKRLIRSAAYSDGIDKGRRRDEWFFHCYPVHSSFCKLESDLVLYSATSCAKDDDLFSSNLAGESNSSTTPVIIQKLGLKQVAFQQIQQLINHEYHTDLGLEAESYHCQELKLYGEQLL